MKTIYEAQDKLGDDTEILLKSGETFAMAGSSLNLSGTNELLGAYGTGSKPVIDFDGTSQYQNMFTTSGNSVDVTFENVSLQGTGANQAFGLEARGTNVAILDVTFNNVLYAVNANGSPTGLLVQDCNSPNATSTYGYFVWGEGNDLSVFGNYVADSVGEHNLRATTYEGLNVQYNNFTNTDGKGCIEMHDGTFCWAAHNVVTGGDIRVGPLGLASDPADSNTTNAVVDSNTFNDTFMQVDPGSINVSIRNNVITETSSQMIVVVGLVSGRPDTNIQILNNTGISTGTQGQFLKVEGLSNDIALQDNLVIAPQLTPGAYSTSIVQVDQANLSSFSVINDNVWQLPNQYSSYAGGGVMLLYNSNNGTGYYTPAQWNGLSGVSTDIFTSTTTSTSTTTLKIADGLDTLPLVVPVPSGGSAAASADAPLGGVFTDFYGNARPTTGSWSAGAVQVGSSSTASPIATINTGTSAGSTGSSSSSSSSKTGGVTGTITVNGVGASGITVYLDSNNDGKLDDGEASTVTGAGGTYSFSGVTAGATIVRQELPSGDKQVTPTSNLGLHITVSAGSTVSGQNFKDTGTTVVTTSSTGTVTGTITDNGHALAGVTVYLDANNNSKRDSSELEVTTNASGVYTFTGVKAGAYIVRQLLPSGISQSTPGSNYGDHISVVANGTITGQNFTDTGAGTVTGTITDGGKGLAGVTVYLDANNDGKLDGTEISTVTGSNGTYSFTTDVLPGTYVVRQVLPSGITQLTPGSGYGDHVTVGAKSTVSSQNFKDSGTIKA